MTVLFWLTTMAMANPPSPALQSRVSGVFVASESPEEMEHRLGASIEAAVQSLPWAFRFFARTPLRRTATRCPEYHLHLDAEKYSVRCSNEEKTFVRRFDREDQHTSDEGEVFDVTLVAQDPTVSLTFSGPRGGQANSWTVLQDGSMRLDCEVFSQHLPDPLRWY
ncbi:MAG: hypothetical protein HN348_31920, partial [Proteobacteria bacterium]|nr:hypothetical protein [Pseudomonadota bacterium]